MDVKNLYAAYIESKKDSWSATTIKNEKWALNGVTEEELKDPQLLYDSLRAKGLKSYSIKTKFVRAGEFVDYLMATGALKDGRNLVKAYLSEHANKFKHAYSKAHLDVTFDEAAKKIATIEDEDVRTKAIQLLYSGMRFTESTTLQNGAVVGKGGWHREVPLAADLQTEFKQSYHTLYRALKKLGLTPHVLRKLCATKLVELGASEADLMKVMGWRSSQMASVYVQAGREKKLAASLKEHLAKESKKDGK